ncbi:MAG: recombinase family protein [bacterium]
MKVFGYVRVSSEEQASRGHSLDAQEEKVRLYCRLHDLELVEMIRDAGVSAKSLKRPGMARALEGLRAGEAAGLVVVKLDRLSRSVRDWAHLIETYFSERAGFGLLSVEDSIDTRTAGGRLVLHVLAAVSQWEREAIGERTRSVLRHKAAKGEPVSRAPRGLRIAGKGLATDLTSDGLRIVVRARELRADGFTFQEIAEALAAEGFRPERGRQFYPSSVRYILRNPRLVLSAASGTPESRVVGIGGHSA